MFTNAWNAAKEKVPGGISNIFGNLKAGLAPIFEKVKNLFSSIKDKFEQAKEKVAETKTNETKTEKVLDIESAANKFGNMAAEVKAKPVDEAKKLCLDALNENEKHTRMYFAERKDYESKLRGYEYANDKGTGNFDDKIQALKDTYLKKSDGTYYNSIEEKYGFDGEDADLIKGKSSFDDIANEYVSTRNEISGVTDFNDVTDEVINHLMLTNEVTKDRLSRCADQKNIEEHSKIAVHDMKGFDPEKAAEDAALGRTESEPVIEDSPEPSTEKEMG